MEAIHTIGRRKTSIARVYMEHGNGNIVINDKDYKQYFPTLTLQYVVNQAFEITNNLGKYDLVVNVQGGGVTGQAEAIRLAVARALVKIDGEFKPLLKAQDLMTRDPRMVERKKPGRKKARKKFQFSKR